MAETTAKTAKASAARRTAKAQAGRPDEQKSAVDRAAALSQEMLKSVEAGQRSAIEAVRKFVDALDKALPAIGDRPSRRESVINAAMDMADRLVTIQYEFVRSVVRGADRWLTDAEAAKK